MRIFSVQDKTKKMEFKLIYIYIYNPLLTNDGCITYFAFISIIGNSEYASDIIYMQRELYFSSLSMNKTLILSTIKNK